MFEADRESFQFCLVNLSDTECAEITSLITENRGEICSLGNRLTIRYDGRDENGDQEVVLHANYIHEPADLGKLLNVDRFIIASNGLKIKEEEQEMFLLVDNDFRTQIEHSYARGEYFNRLLKSMHSDKEDRSCSKRGDKKSRNSTLTIPPEDIQIVRTWLVKTRNSRLTGGRTASANSNVNEIEPPIKVERKAEDCAHQTSPLIAKSFDELENIPLLERLRGLGSSTAIVPSCEITSLKVESPNTEGDVPAGEENTNYQREACGSGDSKSPARLRSERLLFPIFYPRRIGENIQDGNPVAEGSGTVVSPVIPKTELGEGKILGGRMRETLRKIEEFILTSSDGEDGNDTDCSKSTIIIEHKHIRNSPLRLQEAAIENKEFKTDGEIPGTSRGGYVLDEDEEEIDVEYVDDTNVRESILERESDRHSCTSTVRINASRASSDERNNIVSSTRSSDDVIWLSDTSCGDYGAENKTAHSKERKNPNWLKRRNGNRERRKRHNSSFVSLDDSMSKEDELADPKRKINLSRRERRNVNRGKEKHSSFRPLNDSMSEEEKSARSDRKRISNLIESRNVDRGRKKHRKPSARSLDNSVSGEDESAHHKQKRTLIPIEKRDENRGRVKQRNSTFRFLDDAMSDEESEHSKHERISNWIEIRNVNSRRKKHRSSSFRSSDDAMTEDDELGHSKRKINSNRREKRNVNRGKKKHRNSFRSLDDSISEENESADSTIRQRKQISNQRERRKKKHRHSSFSSSDDSATEEGAAHSKHPIEKQNVNLGKEKHHNLPVISSDDSTTEEVESTRSKRKRNPSPIERRDANREKRKPHPFARNFARWEQRRMIKYLIERKLIERAKGYVVWKQMVEDGILEHRTYQSLNNHFRKCILPRIDQFKMDCKYLKKFYKLR